MKPVTLPRPRKVCDEAAADWIGNGRENDGDVACLLRQRGGVRCVLRKNEVGLQRDEFICDALYPLRVAGRCPTIVDPDVAALRPPELLKFLPERRDERLCFAVALRTSHQHADALHLHGFLRACRERPCCRAAEQRDEVDGKASGHAGDNTELRLLPSLDPRYANILDGPHSARDHRC